MNKLTIAIIGVAVAVLLFGGGGVTGWTLAKRSSDKGVIKQQAEDALKVVKHDEKKTKVIEKVKTIYRTRVEKVADPSGCLDSVSPADYINGLLGADGVAKSGFN